MHDKKLFGNGPLPTVFTGTQEAPALAALLGDRGRVVALPAGPCGLLVAAAIGQLQAAGVASVLIEGGGRLNYAALQEGVVDELCLTMAPLLSGDSTASSLADGPAALGEPFLALELISCNFITSGEIFVRYRVEGKR